MMSKAMKVSVAHRVHPAVAVLGLPRTLSSSTGKTTHAAPEVFRDSNPYAPHLFHGQYLDSLVRLFPSPLCLSV